MKTIDVLNSFAEFIGYDREQKKFNVLSADYDFFQIGKKIEMLMKGFDPDGLVSVIYARKNFEKILKNLKLNIFDCITSAELKEELAKYEKMYFLLKEASDNSLSELLTSIDPYIKNIFGKSQIGTRDLNEEREKFENILCSVVEGLGKLNEDVYLKGGKISDVKKFTTKILFFERMADCLIHIEQMPDAIYFCYINQYETADGYFAFVVKSNGTIISINDRIPEAYIGQHGNSRNNRWTDNKIDEIFPYDFIFDFADHDYKGYAKKYIIDTDKLDFSKMQPDVWLPILISMLLLSNKLDGYLPNKNVEFLNTLMKNTFVSEHETTDLSLYNKSEIALFNNSYLPSLSTEKILSGEYGKYFSAINMGSYKNYEVAQHWVDMYGDGFEPDFTDILNSNIKPALSDTGNPKQPEAEFIASKDYMDMEVYRKVRIQLANYITKKKEKELADFGGFEAAKKYWKDKCLKKKDKLIDIFCNYQYLLDNDQDSLNNLENDPVKNGDLYVRTNALKRVSLMTEMPSRYSFDFRSVPVDDMFLNEKVDRFGHYNDVDSVYDDETGKKCSVYYILKMKNFYEMEDFLEEPLPNVFFGYNTLRNEIGCSGNRLLYSTDAVMDIKTSISSGKTFNLCIGFTKNGWKKVYKNWLAENKKI